eukprot:CAMPEP_0196725612 /NCGR_PEP_ID=MMETSP1091-20130531/7111_1 /TAXON_ID=302021 /ORGANISM="Rhodomonas sp., Strain CCMP768" /LENGTH=215 /DNA_ID=CAMNT_0042067911 /DNA_START=22 /DNA_END=669 /DNA_ORIENTATION=+
MDKSRVLTSVFMDFAPADNSAEFSDIMALLPPGPSSSKLVAQKQSVDQCQDPKEPSSPMLSLAESLLDCGETRQQFFTLSNKKEATTMRTVELDISIPSTYTSDEDISCGAAQPQDLCNLGDLLVGGNSSAVGSQKKKVEDMKDPADAPAEKRPKTYLEMIAPAELLHATQHAVASTQAEDANEQRLALKRLKRREQNREAQRRHRMKAKQSGGF